MARHSLRATSLSEVCVCVCLGWVSVARPKEHELEYLQKRVADMLVSCCLCCFSLRCDELGRIVACCADESGHCLVVDSMRKVAALSQHSGKWSATAPTRALWCMREVVTCSAWKEEGDEVTVIMM